MVFSSATFVLLFLPLVYIITRVLPFRFQNFFLMVVSLIFYAWGEPVYIVLMLLSTLVNYFLALIPQDRSKLALTLAGIYNIGMLALFKYTDFLISTVNQLLGTAIPLPGLALPIGISFYTFQALSYVIDVHRGDTDVEKNYGNVLLYISFFPQLIAGPIIVYKDIAAMIKERKMTWTGAANGLTRFIIGLAKKLLIANSAAAIVDNLYAQNAYGTGAAWLMAIGYMIQIYFDFSGYSDMAIGMGEMFGFHFKENFDYPYVAQSVQDFWRRWHISLSSWFKDYVYIPLGGNRRGKAKEIRNKLIVFTLTGLWHGAAWTFVIWGLYHGLFLLLETTALKVKRWPRLLRHIYTLLVVAVGFVIFRADSMEQAGLVIRSMFTPVTTTVANNAAILSFLTPLSVMMLIMGILASFPWSQTIQIKPVPKTIFCTALWVLCLLNLSAATYNPFIYFRF